MPAMRTYDVSVEGGSESTKLINLKGAVAIGIFTTLETHQECSNT